MNKCIIQSLVISFHYHWLRYNRYWNDNTVHVQSTSPMKMDEVDVNM